MLDIGDPFSKAEILERLATVNQAVTDYFAGLAPEAFFAHPPGVWSPAENVQHLIQAVNPVVRIMKFPHAKLEERFGLSSAPSRHYAEIRERYQAGLATGIVAAGSFVPVVEEQPPDMQAAQAEILQAWAQIGQDLVAVAVDWSESDLDIYQAPHPVLNSVTMREMLLFTLYHDLHHVEDAKRLVESD